MAFAVLPDISVVICAYTLARWDDLVTAIDSVQCQIIPPREIIVVVDHNPKLLQCVDEQVPGVITVTNDEPRGLSGARNCGIRAAQGELLAFIDEDALARRDWLERLTFGYSDPNVLGIGGAVEPIWLANQPEWFPEEFNWVVGCSYRGLPQTTAPVRNLIGCNMSFRRKVFDRIGGFKHGIGRVGTRPTGCEETELCIRLTQNYPDSILLYEPKAQVYHRVPGQRTRWRYFGARCYAEGQSKALVSRVVGARASLTSERRYTVDTLPQGLKRNLRDALLHREPMGLARAAAILAGLGITTAGYAIETFLQHLAIWKRPDTSIACGDSLL